MNYRRRGLSPSNKFIDAKNIFNEIKNEIINTEFSASEDWGYFCQKFSYSHKNKDIVIMVYALLEEYLHDIIDCKIYFSIANNTIDIYKRPTEKELLIYVVKSKITDDKNVLRLPDELLDSLVEKYENYL